MDRPSSGNRTLTLQRDTLSAKQWKEDHDAVINQVTEETVQKQAAYLERLQRRQERAGQELSEDEKAELKRAVLEGQGGEGPP